MEANPGEISRRHTPACATNCHYAQSTAEKNEKSTADGTPDCTTPSFTPNPSLPLRSVPLQPPTRRIPLLRKDRPTARHRNRTHQVILHLIPFQRSRQKLVDLHHL